jgi:hypothetical protein
VSLLLESGQIAANATKDFSPLAGTETFGDLLLEFQHPNIALSLIVIKGHSQGMDKSQELNLMSV